MKKSLLLILGLLLTTSLLAGPVGKDEAKVKALAFLNGNSSRKDGVAKAPRQQQNLSLAATGDAYHVFNIGSGNGFVIVSASDLTPDIIGYTDEGAFDAQNMPDNMKAWLQSYADQIAYLEKNGESPAAEAKGLRKAPASVKAPIAPLIETLWDQTAPYNNQVPSGCATGCVATAMSQILYYCNQKEGFPVGTTKDIAGYTDENSHSVLACPQIAFEWANMLKTYSGGESSAEEAAVATLMQYCGASVGMNYGATSNSNTMLIPDALKEYFGFDHHLKNVYRDQYTAIEWDNLIYDELKAERPVVFSGRSSSGGHAFICDGYSEDGYFHFNWGWSGSGNGYFLLSMPNPSTVGVGGGTAKDGYSMNLNAVIGIQKPTGDFTEEDACLTVSTFNYIGSSIVANTETSYAVNFDYCLSSTMTFTHDMQFALGIYDEEDNWVRSSGNLTNVADFSPSGWIEGSRSFIMDFTGLTSGKTYKIKLVCRMKGASDWVQCEGSDKYYIKAEVGATTTTLTTVNPEVNLTASDFELVTDGVAGMVQTLNVKVKNNSATDAYHSNLYLFKSGTRYAAIGLHLDADASTIVSFTFIPTSAETAYWKITTDEAGTKSIGTETVTIKSAVAADNTPTLTSTHSLNLSDDEQYILGTKLIDKVTLTNTSTTKAFTGWIYLAVYKWEGGTGSPTSTETQQVVIPANSSIVVPLEMDVVIDGEYSVVMRYYHNDAWDTALPDNTYTTYVVKPAVKTMAVDGTETIKLAEDSFTVPTDAAVVDLRGQSLVTSIAPNSNPNTLYLLDASATVPTGISNNVVKGTTAANIVLEDGYDFYTPIDFTATKIRYTRTFTAGADGSGNGWSTIILPFDVATVKQGTTPVDWFKSSSDTGKDFWLYQFITDGKGAVDFDYASSIQANTPYLITVPSDHWGAAFDLTGKAITFKASDAAIKADETKTQSGFYYMFTGGSQKQAVTDSYVLNAEGNKFAKTTGDVEPFRAYFYASSHNLQADALAIGFVDNSEATGITELATGNDAETADGAWYTLSGVKLAGKPSEKGIYIYHGKKVAIK